MKRPLKTNRALLTRINQVLGSRFDPMPLVEQRAEESLADRDVIVWEVDPTNFRFQYVSTSAERILGYPPSQWITDPAFWVEKIVHRDDVQDAVAALALATGNGTDQEFDFRAVAADGRVIPLRMIVHTLLGVRGVATHMRGIMLSLEPATRPAKEPYVNMPLKHLGGRTAMHLGGDGTASDTATPAFQR